MKNLTLLVDYPSLFRTTYHALEALPSQVSQDELFKAVQASLYKKISCFDLETVKAIVLFDDQAKSWRYDKLPSYKGTRPIVNEVIKELQTSCLTRINLPSMALARYEADDLIASAIFSWTEDLTTDLFVIISNDQDFYQLCFNATTAVLSQQNGRLKLIKDSLSKADFNLVNYSVDKYRLDPVYELLKKVFLGCPSDNISKLLKKGVGEKKLAEAYQACQDSQDDKALNDFDKICDKVSKFFEISSSLVVDQLELVSLRISHLSQENAYQMCQFFSSNLQPSLKLPLILIKSTTL